MTDNRRERGREADKSLDPALPTSYNGGSARTLFPQTQKLCCWLIPTRDSHTGQPEPKVQ